MRVGSWKMGTLYQAGQLQNVLREMGSYNIELLCVSENRWIDSGKRTLSTGHTFPNSDQTEHQYTSGVAIIMNR